MPGTGEHVYFDDGALGSQEDGVVDDAAKRVLAVIHRLNLTKSLKCSPPACEDQFMTDVTSDSHTAMARKLATESIVMLKNEGGVLPLSGATKVIAVCGQASIAEPFNPNGDGQGHGDWGQETTTPGAAAAMSWPRKLSMRSTASTARPRPRASMSSSPCRTALASARTGCRREGRRRFRRRRDHERGVQGPRQSEPGRWRRRARRGGGAGEQQYCGAHPGAGHRRHAVAQVGRRHPHALPGRAGERGQRGPRCCSGSTRPRGACR
ncbi:unnamed protein product [Prorocentrum cordatum]|uniref:beta-glucosidase n=1 Tax=Prorocentrum cordatum TaxID=2364126 RepID=A0ABN9RJZ1_9DINO|nr:unnamed protein product [Polarella glacialis]